MRQLPPAVNFIPYNGKIADLQENDTAKHTCDLSAYVPSNCVAILIVAQRTGGRRYFIVFPNEGTTGITLNTQTGIDSRGFMAIGIAAGTQRFQWQNSIANDDWDVYMFGYFVKYGGAK